MSQPIASDLSYEVLKLRRRQFELTTPQLDSVNQRLMPLPCAVVQREAFIASRETVHDTNMWAQLRRDRKDEITPTWHFRGKR